MSAVIESKPARVSIVARMADRFGVDPTKMLSTLKATAFRGNVTDEQMMALMIVAEQYKLNPWTKEIYAFPDKHNGIVPVVGVDGWSRIINSDPNFDGMDFVSSEAVVKHPKNEHKPCPEWIECRMHRKDRSNPTIAREYLDECYRPPFVKDGRTIDGPWQSHTKRFLRHKAMIQAARIAFGFVGIYDEDEADRIVTATPTMKVVEKPPLPMPEGFEKQLADLEAVADEGMESLMSVWERLPIDFRTYLTSTDAPKWESIKARAEAK